MYIYKSKNPETCELEIPLELIFPQTVKELGKKM